MDSEWDSFAPFEDDGRLATEERKHVVAFLRAHKEKLVDIQESLSESLGATFSAETPAIGFVLNPDDPVSVPELISTENELLDKVLTVFGVLTDEIDDLRRTAEDIYLPALSTFGHSLPGSDVDPTSGEEEAMIGEALPFLQDVANLTNRLSALCLNGVHQLASLYCARQQLYRATFKHVHLIPAFRAIGQALTTLLTFDCVVSENECIELAWTRYKALIQTARADPPAYGLDTERQRAFERMLIDLDGGLLGAGTFQACVERDFEVPPPADGGRPMVEVRTNRVFLDELRGAVKTLLKEAMSRIQTPFETTERLDLTAALCLYVLHRRMSPQNEAPDTKLYQALWESQKAVPVIILHGKAALNAGEFLRRYVLLPVKKLSPRDVSGFLSESTRAADDALASQTKLRYMQLCAWMIEMEELFQPGQFGEEMRKNFEAIERRGHQLEKGVLLATAISNLARDMLTLHVTASVPLHKKSIPHLCRLSEMLKALEACYLRHSAEIATVFPLIVKAEASRLGTVFRPLRKRLEASRRTDDAKLDVVGALNVLERTAHGSESMPATRRGVLALALTVVGLKGIVQNDELEAAYRCMWKLNILGDLKRRVRLACDCTFLYWNTEVLGLFFADVYRRPENGQRLRFLIAALTDAGSLLGQVRHTPPGPPASEEEQKACPDPAFLNAHRFEHAYDALLQGMLRQTIVDPLCRDLDADLRLRVHSVRNLSLPSAPNPKSVDQRLGVWGSLLRLRRLRLLRTTLDIRSEVTQYLQRTFYNLTTMALHDWQTYSEMRSLAFEKYGLDLPESHLPPGTLDTGLDILQIMRNIRVFVSRFNYNLHQQFFMERRLDAGHKQLNAITVDSIAASIRTHGSGIMNTTVNFTYQFLTKKFAIFSEFLCDEYIKSYLSRERRWYRKNMAEVDNCFPYARAEECAKAIRKLGSRKELSYLDKFRMLITEMGNTIGFVRMVRTAGMHYAAGAMQFIPRCADLPVFENFVGSGTAVEAVTPTTEDDAGDADESSGVLASGRDEEAKGSEAVPGAGFREPTVQAARVLDRTLSALSAKVSRDVDYIALLVKVFRDTLQDGKQGHLRNFFMIVPALCISHCEQARIAKDRMHKAVKASDVYFTNDGFATGIAYLLAILGQYPQFDALHWWDSARQHAAADLARIQQRRSGLGRRKQDLDTLEEIEFQEKRVQALLREVDMLYWSYDGARFFFRTEELEPSSTTDSG